MPQTYINYYQKSLTELEELPKDKKPKLLLHALALKTVLSQKAIKGLIVVDSLALKSISTKAFAKDLTAIKAEGKTLVIVPEKNDKLVKSAQNIASVTLRAVNDISVYDVLDATNIVISKDDVKTLEGGLQ